MITNADSITPISRITPVTNIKYDQYNKLTVTKKTFDEYLRDALNNGGKRNTNI